VEGVTFGLHYAVGALQRSGVVPTQLTLVGGGAASDGWAQLCSDVFELPVLRPHETEAAGVGAARQAQWAVDNVPVSAGADEGERFEPEPSEALREARGRAARLREIALANSL
jgi:xylulokinase